MMFYIIFSASVSIFACRVFLGKHIDRKVVSLIAVNIVFLSLFLFVDALSGNGFDESVVYHLVYGLDGAGILAFTPYIVSAITVIGLCSFLTIFLSRKSINMARRPDNTYINMTVATGLAVALFSNPLVTGFHDQFPLLKAAILQGEHVQEEVAQFRLSKIGRLIKSEISGNSPSAGGEVASDTKNVIWVYAESLERTYFNRQVFGELLSELSVRSAYARRYTSVAQPWGTGWTIGGIVGSQCGLPLVTLGAKNGNSLANIREFMPGASCLGDILINNDYLIEFIGGASAEFAGKGNFLATHGFSTVLDRVSLRDNYDNGSKEVNEWGYYDDFVFSVVKEKALALAEQDKPFFLNALTLDTHSPHGFVSPSCRSVPELHHPNPIAAAVKCSDFLLADLIDWFMASELYDDTLLVLSSDHLSMPNSLYDELESLENERGLLFWVIGKDVSAGIVDSNASTFDIGSTVLGHALGADDVSIGLGRNIENEKSLYNEQFVDADLSGSISGLQVFAWQEAGNSKTIVLDGASKTFSLGSRSYPFPALIEVRDEGFAGLSWVERERKERFIDLIGPDASYVWIDSCGWSAEMKHRSSSDFCAHFLNSGAVVESRSLDRSDRTEITLEDVVKAFSGAGPELKPIADIDYAISVSGHGGGGGLAGANNLRAKRGVNLFEKAGPNNEWRLTANFDLCAESRTADAPDYDNYTPNGPAVIVVHDSAHCGNSEELNALAKSFRLKQLGTLQFRQPYIALLEEDALPVELPGQVGFTSVVALPKI